MQPIKAIFLDVDGTLISFTTHRVPESAVDAVCRAHDNGIKIIIATGRASADLEVLSDIPYDAVAALNGTDCIMRDGTVVTRHPIPTDQFAKALELARVHDFVIAIENNDGILVNRLTPEMCDFMRYVAHPVPPVVNLEAVFAQGDCCQLCFFCNSETQNIIMPQLPALSASRWHPFFADINVKGIDKATAVDDFAHHFQIDLSQTMAVGDGGNDVPMILRAGIGIAMGNANDEVKTYADYVTTDVDSDGLAAALRHFLKN